MASVAAGLAPDAAKPRVVIAGGGVIGCATAYFLARDHGVGATVVDRKGVAAAASGRAGGFLAQNWNDQSPTEKMTHRSFDLHATLGEELKKYGATDYRRLTCAAIAAYGQSEKRPSNKKLENVEWADDPSILGMNGMGDEETIAQVHPRKLCDAFIEGARRLAGCTVVEGVAAGLREGKVEVNGGVGTTVDGLVLKDGTVLDADAVVLCLGPWSHALGRPADEPLGLRGAEDETGWGLAGCPPVLGIKYHAVLLQAPRPLSQAVFFRGHGDPEVYPRADGEVYVTGSPDPGAVVLDLPGETEVRDEVCDGLRAAMDALSSELRGAPENARQACHLPSATDGRPVVGRLRRGCYVGYGHGCWGILLAPATGEALANLIVTGKSPTLDLKHFDPARFAKLGPDAPPEFRIPCTVDVQIDD